MCVHSCLIVSEIAYRKPCDENGHINTALFLIHIVGGNYNEVNKKHKKLYENCDAFKQEEAG